jgi:hypothetical protein
MAQFNRDYLLVLTVDNTTIEIRPPLRISFDGHKSDTGGLNKLTVDVFNLKESTRLKLIKDPEQSKRIGISLQVGYKGQLREVYKGSVHRGQVSRNGTDYISKLECLDGGDALFNSKIAKTVKGKEDAINQLVQDAGIERGAISLPSQLTRPKVMIGNTIKSLDSFLEDGYSWFIDDGKLNIINREKEVLSGFVPVVSAETGLITTPQREQSIISFDTIMNPSIRLGGLVEVFSTVAPHLNGKHKVFEINFKGDLDGDAWTMSVRTIAGQYETIN